MTDRDPVPPSMKEATARLARAQAAFARCPENHANEGRLHAALLEAQVAYGHADIRRLQSELAAEKNNGKSLRSLLDQRNETLAGLKRLQAEQLRAMKSAAEKKRAKRKGALPSLPMLELIAGPRLAAAQSGEK